MYLFILESFGTSELILIGIVALIVFGPRKLPQMARTIGKTIADFKRTTNEFKTTWEKEADLEGIKQESKNLTSGLNPFEDPGPPEDEPRKISGQNTIQSPEIKEINSSEMERLLALKEEKEEKTAIGSADPEESDKRGWL